jgi:porphobilinogen synthase
MRQLVREHQLGPEDFIYPLFLEDGKGIRQAISALPGQYRISLDLLAKEAKEIAALGIPAVLLFVKVPDELKDNQGKEALNPQGLMQRAIQEIKNAAPELVVMTDVALDPYSIYGHDGIVENGMVQNDATLEVLAQMSLSHAQAGADVVAPSDMMDGRIAKIRQTLEANGYSDTGILSYSAKYASAYYGPFREALDSAPVDQDGIPKDKKTYQMDPANAKEALRETRMDIDEGADIVMVKPGMPYLDIVRFLASEIQTPIAVYQVSGEYAMLKAAAEKGWLDHDHVMLEQLLAFKRAGASMIATYHAKDASRLLG